MYKIISTADGREIGAAEKPHFIRRSSAGCYVQADEETALGVAYRGTPYNLEGRENLGAKETVRLIEFDAGEKATDTAAAVSENTERITGTEDALCEQDAAVQERFAAIEDALCELDKN